MAFQPLLNSSRRPIRSSNWHPILSPYRLTVLLTTIGLGTSKAIATYRGSNSLSTTIEWILGVVIFLVLHSAGVYDSEENVPRRISWFWKKDCMVYLWTFLSSKLVIDRPLYQSYELRPPPGTDIWNEWPIFTMYRLILSVNVIALGSSKALLTFLGFSSAMNWVDWMLGVVVTSSLSIIGFYEYNPFGIWQSFFKSDRLLFVNRVGRYMTNIALLFGPFAWIAGWGWILVYFLDYLKSLKDESWVHGNRTFAIGLWISVISAILLCLVSGYALLVVLVIQASDWLEEQRTRALQLIDSS